MGKGYLWVLDLFGAGTSPSDFPSVFLLTKISLAVFVCLFDVIKPRNPNLTSRPGLEVNPLGVYPLGSSSFSCSVLSKVHHHQETLYVPTEVNTPQVDGLARFALVMGGGGFRAHRPSIKGTKPLLIGI